MTEMELTEEVSSPGFFHPPPSPHPPLTRALTQSTSSSKVTSTALQKVTTTLLVPFPLLNPPPSPPFGVGSGPTEHKDEKTGETKEKNQAGPTSHHTAKPERTILKHHKNCELKARCVFARVKYCSQLS